MSGLTYVKTVNLEIANKDDRQISYTDDDANRDLTNFTQKFIIADSVENIFNNPKETITESSMTVSGRTSSFTLPDTIGFGAWVYRWIFTDADGKDNTTHKGLITIV